MGNTLEIVGDCPIWGDRVVAKTHSAFSLKEGWKKKQGSWYNTDFNQLKARVGHSQRFDEIKQMIAKKKSVITTLLALKSQQSATNALNDALLNQSFYWNDATKSQQECKDLQEHLNRQVLLD